MASFVSVYVDWAATVEQVRMAAKRLPMPAGVLRVDVVEAGDTFGCRIAVDLTGDFDEQRDGPRIARAYAAQLSEVLAVPAFALPDLILTGRSD
ncbi:hypothetical protein ORI20_28295 [Mycobacterium sp. CVI_P3]|uniref:Uncharacterized protein n=1 Tax=Mycobacterium pinniadriaticum TaxID=2994102 RepID=A0ABT3SM32_9MYCO|nr:hypothetical protein [Mycobacterium pinniadriaticum]MCX2934174.1 hypothetical protein [Mycobacterium pinniadriaticum]MCX2940596.1 hypothetical protein [Mycobacterium pinniadriaticum]